MVRYDIAIIGTGPAGISAAVTAKIRGKNIILIGNKNLSDKITRASKIENYTALPDISGSELAQHLHSHLESLEIDITDRRVSTVYAMGSYFAIQADEEIIEANSVIVASGVMQGKTLKGEKELLGSGVSYCATCDGMLYRGKKIAVLCNDPKYEHEVEYLADLAAEVYYYPAFADSTVIKENVHSSRNIPKAVNGEKKVESITLRDGGEVAVDGLFCLRNAIAPSTLIPGLTVDGGHIVVDREQRTNLAGCFAAGDCTGRPYQYTKAVGEGNVAAHSCIEYLANQKKD